MGSTSTEREQSLLTDHRVGRESRPSLGPAIVSGGCAVMVALITGLFNWVNRSGPSPSVRTPILTIEPRTRPNPLKPASDPAQTAAITELAAIGNSTSPPQYKLNFAAFQTAVKDRESPREVRQQVLDCVVDQTVVWQGYVRSVTEFQQHDQGWVASVELVENPTLLTQSMFLFPAHCRFNADPGHKVARLERGALVTISGVCQRQGVDAVATNVLDCQLMDAFYDAPGKNRGR
ncbi:MAG: hypothetical protein ACK5Q5_13250 [Planctomycetaceae bacterium]